MNGSRVVMSLVLALCGCAPLAVEERDRILIDHGGGALVSVEQIGLVFGSIGFVPRDDSMSALSFHLRSTDGKGQRFEIFATNRQRHAYWRAPDVDTEAQRLWVFSGRVPVGRYEIPLAALSGADARDIHFVNFKQPIPVTVTAGGAVYLGRWQYTPPAAQAPGQLFRIPGTSLALRDTPQEDQSLLVRRRGHSPVGNREIDDVLRPLIQGAGT